MTQVDWPERLKEIVQNPNVADRLGTADLKRACKMLAKTVLRVGAAADETALVNQLLQQRIRELTGRRPPEWSYMHQEEVQLLHRFNGFSVEEAEHAFVVCGREPGNTTLRPLYEYDLQDYDEPHEARSQAQLMCSQLRETFLPRSIKDDQQA